MENVFIVVAHCGMDCNVIGVYSSLDLAKNCVDANYIDGGLLEYSIEEHLVQNLVD